MAFRIVDNEFNREHYPQMIGRCFSTPNGWAGVMDIGRMVGIEKFRSTGKDVEDIGKAINDESWLESPGRVYIDNLFLHGPFRFQGGPEQWGCLIGSLEFEGTLADMEKELFAFAVSEGYVEADPDDLEATQEIDVATIITEHAKSRINANIRFVDADPDDPDEQIDLAKIAEEHREEVAMEMEHERLIAEQECNYFRGLGLRNDR